jgi:Zn-dependent M28 family amino/carboxypeptidase
MKRIRITRDAGGNVSFDPVAVDTTDTVFFINLDPLAEHFPTIASNKLGMAPSPPSSQCHPQAVYGCHFHPGEQGTIQIFAQLAATNNALSSATRGQPIPQQKVVKGGMSPYQISGEVFQVVDAASNVIQGGSGIGPGLQLVPTPDNKGIFVEGTPTVSGTYQFTFVVDDGMGKNLQQIQYSMAVT